MAIVTLKELVQALNDLPDNEGNDDTVVYVKSEKGYQGIEDMHIDSDGDIVIELT